MGAWGIVKKSFHKLMKSWFGEFKFIYPTLQCHIEKEEAVKLMYLDGIMAITFTMLWLTDKISIKKGRKEPGSSKPRMIIQLYI